MARLGNSQANDLRRVSQIDIPDLEKLVDALNKHPPSIRLSRVQELFASVLEDAETVSSLLRWLYFIRSIAAAPTASTSHLEVFSRFAEIARAENDIGIDPKAVECIAALASSEQLYAVWQAQNLSRDVEHLYQSTSIVVDIRPVFNQSRTEVVGELVMPFLKLAYAQDSDVKGISIALDVADIEQLQSELSKLLRKIDVIKSKSDGIERYLVGEEAEFGGV